MSDYVLLYRSTPEAHDEAMGSPEKTEKSLVKWRAWLQDMTEKGHLKSVGLPLERKGAVVGGGRRQSVTDGPYTETKELVGGFSIIVARDLDHATEIASGCPILERGGSVEVRPVMSLPV